jgi:precorrin-4 methylase
MSTRSLRRRQALAGIFILAGLLFILIDWGHGDNWPSGKFYIIGTGPAGPEHATLKALDCLKAADVVLCSEEIGKRFQTYLEGKTILCDPWKGMFDYKGTPWRELVKLRPEDKKAFQEERIRIRENIIKQIKTEMAQGKRVALLDEGDPCLFGPSHWFREGFADHQVEIIPGMGAFSAAMAALKKSSIPAYDTRFVLQSSPFFLRSEDPAVREVLRQPATLVFYMGLPELPQMVEVLKKYQPADLPIAVVYFAGFPEKEKVVKGTLANILEKISQEKEKWLAMIIVGRCLEGKPYRARVENLVGYQDVKKNIKPGSPSLKK